MGALGVTALVIGGGVALGALLVVAYRWLCGLGSDD